LAAGDRKDVSISFFAGYGWLPSFDCASAKRPLALLFHKMAGSALVSSQLQADF
jgi:hypothetical protein